MQYAVRLNTSGNNATVPEQQEPQKQQQQQQHQISLAIVRAEAHILRPEAESLEQAPLMGLIKK